MTILIVAHDAGGAEVLSSYIYSNPGEYVFCLSGPAVTIFQRKLGEIITCDLAEGLDKAESLICSTGWQTDFEYQALNSFKKTGKKVIAFLDHWVNYLDRFIRDGVKCLPDEIWVADAYAKKLASNIFDVPVLLQNNDYINFQKKSILSYDFTSNSVGVNKILYLAEPIRDHVVTNSKLKLLGYDEYSAYEYFQDNIAKVSDNVEGLTIRLHPSESVLKYDSLYSKINVNVNLSQNNSLHYDIARHSIVVGCETMAMYVAAQAGKKVISCIPPEGKNCSLPLNNIQMLRDM